jgi:molecular chaperone GrpE
MSEQFNTNINDDMDNMMQTDDDAVSLSSSPENQADVPLTEEEIQAAKFQELELKLADSNDKLLRTRADFDNYRKRMQREMGELASSIKSSTLADLFPVFDHFQFAVQAVNTSNDIDSLKQGMNLILGEFDRFFNSNGVQKISTNPGDPFDPKWHEAVSMEESSEIKENHLIREMKSGYRIDDRLIRPATVVVSSGKRA